MSCTARIGYGNESPWLGRVNLFIPSLVSKTAICGLFHEDLPDLCFRGSKANVHHDITGNSEWRQTINAASLLFTSIVLPARTGRNLLAIS